jgi:hypothetical protein
MNRQNRLTFAAALVASFAGLASADFSGAYAAGNWSMESNSWGSPSVSQSNSSTLDLHYDFNGNTDAYYTTLYTDFGAVATESATYTMDYSLHGFHSWYLSYAQMWTFVDDANGRSWTQVFNRNDVAGGFDQFGSLSIQTNAGYKWGVTFGGGHYDGSNLLQGTATLSNFVPAPGPAALLGLGALASVRRRR